MKTHLPTTALFRKIAQTSTLYQAMSVGGNAPNLLGLFKGLLEKSGFEIPVLAQKMMASRAHVYQFFEGVRKPGRDMLLRMAFVMKLSLEDTQRLLTVAQRGALYPRVRRDAALIFMLQRGYTLLEADEALRAANEQPLLPSVE